VLLGERHLRRAVDEFVDHYHLERNQSIAHHPDIAGERQCTDRAP
jgi:hypothetical protein